MTLDEILDMPVTKIQLCAELVNEVYTERLMAIVEPISVALGGEYKATKGPAARRKKRSQMTPEEKEAALMSKIGALGIPIMPA